MPERICKSCGANLSSYNPGLLCLPCLKKNKETLEKQIADTPHYTVDDLCLLLGYTNPESVKRLGRKGKIPGRIREIKQHLYLREEVDQWLSGQQPKDTGAVPTPGPGQASPEVVTSSIVNKHYFEHWKRLGQVAEELKLGLEYNRGLQDMDSRFGGTVWAEWKYDPRTTELTFSAQQKDLWPYFLVHMSAEYPTFDEDFKRYLDIARCLIKDNLDDQRGLELQPVRTCHETEALKQQLWLVIERGTLKGICDICQD
jgi:hypothetical protein